MVIKISNGNDYKSEFNGVKIIGVQSTKRGLRFKVRNFLTTKLNFYDIFYICIFQVELEETVDDYKTVHACYKEQVFDYWRKEGFCGDLFVNEFKHKGFLQPQHPFFWDFRVNKDGFLQIVHVSIFLILLLCFIDG